ncbi:MAG: CvpA family protein [Muribaculaceae bacterium]|nr:CvpA family protein [Muribaculaceae bacterium]
MNTLDIVVVSVIVVSAIYGYYKGILSQVGGLVGIIAGVICCRIFGDDLAVFFNDTFANSTSTKESTIFLNNVIAHVVIFVAAYLGMRFVASLMSTVLKKIKLGTINRVAGAVFAPVQWLVILSIALNLWIVVFPETELVKSSSGIANETIINLAPDIFGTDTAQEILNAGK